MAKVKTLAQLMNDVTFFNLFQKYKNLAINVFQWNGLPPSIDEAHIEKALFSHGMCMVFDDPYLPVLNTLPCFPGQGLNIHGEPINYIAMGNNYNKEYNRKGNRCTVIFNNKMFTPTQGTVMMYLNEIVDTMRTTFVHVRTMKAPFIVTGSDETVTSFKKAMREIMDNEYLVMVDEALNTKGIQVLNTGVKFYGKELMEYRQMLENELLTFLGVNTVPIRKAERLITAEAESNNEFVTDNVQIMLEARQKAAQEINEKFGSKYGINVTVELRNKQKEDGENVRHDVGANSNS